MDWGISEKSSLEEIEKFKKINCRSFLKDGRDKDGRCPIPKFHKNPIFAKAGEKRKRCKEHIQEGDVNVLYKRCNSEYCMILDEYSRGFASKINPKTGKKEFCPFCFFCINEFM